MSRRTTTATAMHVEDRVGTCAPLFDIDVSDLWMLLKFPADVRPVVRHEGLPTPVPSEPVPSEPDPLRPRPTKR